jgi:cyclophilin family peptidyl-prolyl cis-trans isomerase
MKFNRLLLTTLLFVLNGTVAPAAPAIDPIPDVNVPAGKSLTIPITASSPNGRTLSYTFASSTSGITVERHTNNPFWKMSVVQISPSNAPGAFLTPFRGGLAMVTNIGDMTFMLLRDRAPRTVDAISALTTSGFYNSNTIFHRVVLVPYFIIQGGDPNTNGTGGPVFRYDDEIDPHSLFTGSGQLGAANSGPDTDGSQFFVTAAPQRDFDLRYTIFGQLLRGFNVLSNVLTTATNATSRPLADVLITRASLVPNTTDAVITLTCANLPGVTGTIRVVADDGVGGRATNSFTATTVEDMVNSIPFLNSPAITNLIVPVNGSLTNFISAVDLEDDPVIYDAYFVDQNAFNNSTFTTYPGPDGKFILTPKPGYSGPLRIYVAVAADDISYLLGIYDYQEFTVAVGDTAVTALAANFVAEETATFTNQPLATFTNGVANSAVSDFTAFINWGDNSTNSGVIHANANGLKEVRGTHTYTNSGDYPIYVTIRSALGAATTVVSTGFVQPRLSLMRSDPEVILRWPAWAADYQLQSLTDFAASQWTPAADLPSLAGYEIFQTNVITSTNVFFRLKR